VATGRNPPKTYKAKNKNASLSVLWTAPVRQQAIRMRDMFIPFPLEWQNCTNISKFSPRDGSCLIAAVVER
jgi:hypothetical protein